MMVLCIDYLVKVYNSPFSLLNIDPMGIHLVLMTRERTWEKKGSKDLGVLGGDDKKSITICVFSFANGALFPLQLIFQRIMKQALPKTCPA